MYLEEFKVVNVSFLRINRLFTKFVLGLIIVSIGSAQAAFNFAGLCNSAKQKIVKEYNTSTRLFSVNIYDEARGRAYLNFESV